MDREIRLGGPTVSGAETEIDSKLALTVVLPWPMLDTSPAVLIVATVVVAEDQTTNPVTFCVLPSLKVPVA